MPDSDDHVSELYQASRQRLEPPGELDRRILAEAHRAVGRRRLSYRTSYHAAALAATVVLGVGLAWLQLHAPQVVDDAMAPMQESVPQRDKVELDSVRTMKRREAPAALQPVPAPAGLATPQAVPPAPERQRQSAPATVRPHFSSFGMSKKPEADTAVAAEAKAESEQALSDADLPCGLTTRPPDREAWQRLIAEATLLGDEQTLTCLQRAMYEAIDDADR